MNLKAGYNPNYQDMAVLEAVRGWDALKLEEELQSGEGESPQTTSEDSQAVETESEAAPLEVSWTDDRIDDLKATDPLSVLLEHERHIAGGAPDGVASTCK
jgi:protein kinase C substrate 80K-H